MNYTMLNLDEALNRLDNDMDLYKILSITFLHETSFDTDFFFDLIQKFMRNPSNTEYKNKLSAYVHYIKGAASQLSATTLTEIAQILESNIKKEEVKNINILANEFYKSYTETIKELEKIIL